MDRNERINDHVNALRQSQDGLQQRIWTALPAILESYDDDAITCTAQPAVQAQIRNPDTGEWTNATLPLCLDCPVIFPSGGGYGLTLPLQQGNEGLLLFASRCIDAWWQSGGVQPQAEFRMHDLSDGFFIPGCFSKPNAPTGVSSTAARFWKQDGTMYVELAGLTGIATVKAPTEIVLDAPLVHMTGTFSAAGGAGPTGVVMGDLHVSGTMTGDTDVVAGTTSLKTHVHSGVQPGGGDSGPPV